MWVPLGSPGLALARPCHPVLRDQGAPRTHLFLQIHLRAQSQAGHCPSSQQLTEGGLGSPRDLGWGWVRGGKGPCWRRGVIKLAQEPRAPIRTQLSNPEMAADR